MRFLSFPLPSEILEELQLVCWFFGLALFCFILATGAERVLDLVESKGRALWKSSRSAPPAAAEAAEVVKDEESSL